MAYLPASPAVYVRRSSRRLHGKEVRAILRTSLSYFDSVPIGRILSRFSQDLFVIDFELGSEYNVRASGHMHTS